MLLLLVVDMLDVKPLRRLLDVDLELCWLHRKLKQLL
jgi:hypothetical protein